MRGKPVRLPSTDPRLKEVVERLKAGGSLVKESKALGFTHNGPLRAALRELLGKENYSRMMSRPKSFSCPGISVTRNGVEVRTAPRVPACKPERGGEYPINVFYVRKTFGLPPPLGRLAGLRVDIRGVACGFSRETRIVSGC